MLSTYKRLAIVIALTAALSFVYIYLPSPSFLRNSLLGESSGTSKFRSAIEFEKDLIEDEAYNFISDSPRNILAVKNSGESSSFECRCMKHKQPTCLFRNVCYNLKLDKLVYYGIGCSKIPEAINTRAVIGDREVHLNVHCSPAQDLHNAGPMQQGLFALIHEYYRRNPGHTMGDEVWAVYQAMRMFNLHNVTDIQVVTFESLRKIDFEQYSSLTSRKPIQMNDIKTLKDGLACFSKLIVGWTRMGFYFGHNAVWTKTDNPHIGYRSLCLPPFKRTFWDFRQHSLKMLGITEPSLKPHRPVIRFLTKRMRSDHPLVIQNLDDIVKNLTLKNPMVVVEVTDFSEISTLKKQAELMIQTDLVITIGGASMINGVFLPIGAEIIEICAWLRSFKFPRYMHESTKWLQYSHVRMQYLCYPDEWSGHNPVILYETLIKYVRLALRRRNLSGGKLIKWKVI